MTVGPHGRTTVEEAGDPVDPCISLETQAQFDELLHRLPTRQQKIQREAQEFFLAKNRSAAKDGQSRDQRFIHKGVLEPAKVADDDGYISDDDCVAVLFDVTEGGPKQKKPEYRVYYGNVAKVTYNKVDKRVLGPRAHLTEKSGEAVCKWFDEKMETVRRKKGHVIVKGQRAYHLALDNPTGFNDKVEFPSILCGVRMTFDAESDCWLLNAADYNYAEAQKERFASYHNGTQAYRN